MGEEAAAAAAVTAPRSSAASAASSSRFLGLLKQPDRPDPNPNLELDESDVVWSSSAAAAAEEDPYSFDSSTSPTSSAAAAAAYSPSDHLRRRHFVPERFGLSALLADDAPPLRPPGAARPTPLPAPAPEEKVRNGFRESAPVAVPVWPKRRAMEAAGYWGEEEEEGRGEEEDGEEEGEEMVPPHVIVARSHVTRLSVLEGAGRTLKGRDLRCVRNAVLRKTGFLDL